MASNESILTLVLRIRDETKATLAAVAAQAQGVGTALKNSNVTTAQLGVAAATSSKSVADFSTRLNGLERSAVSTQRFLRQLFDTLNGRGTGSGLGGSSSPIGKLDIDLAALERKARQTYRALDIDLNALHAQAKKAYGAIDVDLAKLERDAAKAAASMRKVSQDSRDVGRGAQGIRDLGNAAQASDGQMRNFGTGLGTVKAGADTLVGSLRALVVGFLGLQAVQVLKNFADQAARVQVLGTALRQIALNAGITSAQINKTDRDVQKLGITASASRQALSQFIQSGLDISRVTELARAAQDLAVVAGKNSSELFQNVILNITQLDTVGLRYNGIIISAEEATQKYAQTLGKSAESLSQTEKQQAFLNASIEYGKSVQGLYEKSLSDVGKQLQSLKRYQEEASVSIGQNLLPTYLLLVEEFTLFLKQSKLITDSFSEQGEGAKQLAENLKPIVQGLREVAVFVVEHIGVITTLLGAYLGLAAVNGVVRTLTASWAVLAPVLGFVLASIGGVAREVLAFATRVAPAAVVALRGIAAAAAAFALTPMGIAIIAIGAAIAGLTIAVVKNRRETELARKEQEQFNKLTNTEVQDLVSKKVSQRVELEEQLKDILERKTKAEKDGNEEAIAAADEELAKANELKKSLDEQIAKLREKAAVRKIPIDSDEEIAAANKQKKEIEKEAKATRELLLQLKRDSDNAFKGLDISKEFGTELTKVEGLIEKFQAKTKDETGRVIVSFGQVQLSLQELASKARTLDELTAAIELLQTKAKSATNAQGINSLIDTLTLRQGKAAIEQIDQALGGFLDRMARSNEQNKLLNQLAEDARNFSSGLRRSFEEMGVGLDVASNGIVQTSDAFNELAASAGRVGQLEAAGLDQQVNAISARYKTESDNIERVRQARIREAQSTIIDVRAREAAVAAIEKDTVDKRRANYQEMYKSLKSQQDEYTQKVTESAQRIRQIEEEIRSSKRSEEDAIFNVRLQGLNEVQRLEALNLRNSELRAQAQAALAAGDLESAKRINEERKSIVQSIAGEAKTTEQKLLAEFKIRDVYKEQRDILGAQKDEEKERLALQIQSLNQLTTALNELTRVLGGVQGKTVDVKVNADKRPLDQLNQAIQSQQSGTKDVRINVDRTQLDRAVTDIDRDREINAETQVITDPQSEQALESLDEQTKDITVRPTIIRTEDNQFIFTDERLQKQVEFNARMNPGSAAEFEQQLDRLSQGTGEAGQREVLVAVRPNQESIDSTGNEVNTRLQQLFTEQEASRTVRVQAQLQEGTTQRIRTEIDQAVSTTDQQRQVNVDVAVNRSALDQLNQELAAVSASRQVNIGVQVDRGQYDTFISSLAGARDLLVVPKLDQGALQNIRRNIEQALAGITFTLKGSVESGTTLFRAAGGRINGPGSGTSDDVLMWGSNGEWVIKHAAVQHYGEDFMARLNSMTLNKRDLPAYAEGGRIGGPSRAMEPTSNDEVTLNLNLNGRPLGPVRGARATVKGLVVALKDMQRGG